jgi:hypothetical protein
MKTFRTYVLAAIAAIGVAGGAAPAAQQPAADQEWCNDQSWSDDREGVCEVRQFTLPATGATLNVDAAPNGGIQVEGAPRSDISVLARVVATARTQARAREIARAVVINPTADRVEARGPERSGEREESWHVSYRLAVPINTPLSLESVNGGISTREVESRIEFRTTNGGVKLIGVGGDVRGRTMNGGVNIELEGATWRGDGLDVETSNGGVQLTIPENYSAELQASTRNGGLRSDIGMEAQGRRGRVRDINTMLGGGGPPIRIRTSNGGVRIARK